MYSSDLEIDEYRIKKCDFKNNTFTTSLGNITLNKTTLILRTKNNHIVKYVHFKNANTYNENYNSIKTLELINKRIVSKNKKSIFDFVPINSICDCNKELGKINIITQTGNGKSWVLEMRDDENKIILYEVSDDEMKIGRAHV